MPYPFHDWDRDHLPEHDRLYEQVPPVVSATGGLFLADDGTYKTPPGSGAPVGVLFSKMKTDGTDQSTQWASELNALYAAGGGMLVLPSGPVRIDSQTVLPNDGGTTFRQPPIILAGQGARQDGQWHGLDTALGGTVLDLRYAGADAKIVTLGTGLFAVYGVTFADFGTSSTPFILTTNTTLRFREVSFVGNPSKSGSTCDQDAIILGGTNAVAGNLTTSAFQGYGTTFDGVTFSRIRRGFYGHAWCNSVVFDNATWDNTCGGQTAMEFDGTGTNSFSKGNTGTGNLIEMTNYLYGITFTGADNNHFYGTSFWDAGAGSVAAVRLVGAASGNEMISCYGMAGKEVEANGNTYLYTANGQAHGLWLADQVWSRPYTSQSASTKIIGAYRSLADSTDAGRALFEVSYDGTVTVTGLTAGSPKIVMTHATAGTLTMDHQSLVRSTGYLRLYAGTAADMIEITRGVLKIGSGTTANRPAISGRPGLHYFDTTLNKPIWSNAAGTGWVDATGATV